QVAAEALIDADLAEGADRAALRRRHLTVNLAAGDAEHSKEGSGALIDFGADLGRKIVEDVVADERVEHRVAVVRAAEVRVAVVDLKVTNAKRRVLHDALE